MKKDKLKTVLFWALAAVLSGIIVIIIVMGRSGKKEAEETDAVTDAEPIVRYVTETKTVYVDKVVPVEVEKEITTDIIEEGLHDMGILVTEDYCFKEVTTFESEKTVAWVVNLNSKLVMGYEGTLYAGIDFEKVTVKKDDSAKKITVFVPASEIMSRELDYDSFEVYEEDVSRWNPITAEDYNGSVEELINRAEERAIERGILEKADKNARTIIESFIESLLGRDEYKIVFEEAK